MKAKEQERVRAQRRPTGKEKYSASGVRVRLANSVAVKQQMGSCWSESYHRWFSRWIVLGWYSLGGDFSCWDGEEGQLRQGQDSCFAWLCACVVMTQAGCAGTMLSAIVSTKLRIPYVPLRFRFSLSVAGRKKFATSGLTTSFLPADECCSIDNKVVGRSQFVSIKRLSFWMASFDRM